MDYTKEQLAYSAQWLYKGATIEGILRSYRRGMVYAIMQRDSMGSYQSIHSIRFTRKSAQDVSRRMAANGSIYYVLDALVTDVWRDGRIGKQVKSNLREEDRDLFWTIAGAEIVRQDWLMARQDKQHKPIPLDILL